MALPTQPPVQTGDQLSLQQIKSNLIQILANETLYQVTYGAKPSYSIDGKNVPWTEWRVTMLQKIDDIDYLIQKAEGPFEVRSQGVSQ